MRPALRTLLFSGAAFNPLSLFAGGQVGALYDPSDLTTLWQDSARTTPVVTDGDPVGAMDDISGNGNHMLQSSSSLRPLYKTAGGLHWIEGDGISRRMVVTFAGGAISHPLAVMASVRQLAAGTKAIGDGLDNTQRLTMTSVADGRVATYQGSASLVSTATPATTGGDFVMTAIANSPNSALYVNNALEASGSAGSNSISGYRLFCDRSEVLGGNFRYYGGMIRSGALSPADRVDMYRHLARKAGLTP